MTISTADFVSSAFAAFPSALPALVMLLKVTCVLVAALGATLLMQRASAGARHLIWLVTLAGLLVLPALAAWGPLPLRVLPAQFTPAADPVPAGEAIMASGEHTVLAPWTPTGPSQDAPVQTPVDQSMDLRTTLLLIWGLGAAVLLGRLALGAWSVHRIVRQGRLLEHPDWQTPLYQIADRLGLEAAPILLQSDEVKMPFAAGLFTHRIVLPAESEGWSTERRSAVLIHELGHVRRRDLIGHTLSRIVCAVYWFHPLVWTAARQLRAESERACDDLALVFGARPSDYAEHLLDIVTCVRDHNTPAIALAMAHRREFEGRMLAILNPELRRRGPSRLETASLVGSLVALALLVGAASPLPREAPRYSATLPSSTELAVQRGDTAPAQAVRSAPPTRQAARPERLATVPAPAPRAEPQPSARPAPAADPAAAQREDERVDVLARTLRTDANAEVRRVAAWGLARYAHDNSTAVEALTVALVNDANAAVREMAAWGLAGARHSDASSAALLTAIRRDKDPEVRTTAVWAAGAVGNASAIEGMIPLLQDPSAEVREMTAWAIGSCRPTEVPAGILKLLTDSDRDVRMVATWAIYTINDPKALSAVQTAFERETDPEVKTRLIYALGGFGEASVSALQKMITSGNDAVREAAVNALAKGGGAGGPWPWPRPQPRPFP